MEKKFFNSVSAREAVMDKEGLKIRGAFQCSLHFKKDLKPFTLVEEERAGRKVRYITATIVISPDDGKDENGKIYLPIRYDNKFYTFAELVKEAGADLYKDRLYATAYFSGKTLGLNAVLADPSLAKEDAYKLRFIAGGEMVFRKGKDGKVFPSLRDITVFTKDTYPSDASKNINLGTTQTQEEPVELGFTIAEEIM